MNSNILLFIVIIILIIFLFCKNNIEKFSTNCAEIKGTCSSALCPSDCQIGKNDNESTCFCKTKE